MKNQLGGFFREYTTQTQPPKHMLRIGTKCQMRKTNMIANEVNNCQPRLHTTIITSYFFGFLHGMYYVVAHAIQNHLNGWLW